MKVYPLSQKQINIIFKIIFIVIFILFCISILFSLLISLLPNNIIGFINMLFGISINFPTFLKKGLFIITNRLSTINIMSFKISMFKNSVFLIVILGFILIILNNIDILKSVIKNFSLNRISKSVKERETTIENSVSMPFYLNIFFVVLSVLLVILFFHQYFSHIVYIHPENYITLPLQMKAGPEIYKQCIPTIFNLDNFEGGSYRPRVVSFLVDYISVNALPLLNKIFPFWGIRNVLTVLGICLSVTAMYVLFNDFFKAMPVGLKLFLSVFPIYFINFQSWLPIFYRTSKYLVVPLGLFILRYFFKNYKISFTKRGIPWGLLAWILLSLSTLYDEQLVAVIFFFFCLSLLYSLISKKLYMNTVVFASAFVFFLFWNLCFGKYLFSIFTPHPLAQHQHNYTSLYKYLNLHNIYDVTIIYYNLINNNFKVSFPILFFMLGFSFVNKNIEGKSKIWLITLSILSFSFLLVCAICFGGGITLFLIPFFNNTSHLAFALFLFYFASIYFSINIFRYLPYKKIFTGIILLSLLTVIIDNHYRQDEYYSVFLSISKKRGYLVPNHSGELSNRNNRFDKILMEKNIDLKYIHTTMRPNWSSLE